MTNQTANPYVVLGVPPTASAAQLRDAYRRLAKEYHPDQNRDVKATERMQQINRAWEMLSSPAARARYEAEAPPRPAARYPHWESGRRPSQPFAQRQAWAASQAGYAAEYQRDDDPGPLRWGLLLLAVPVVVLLSALLGGLVPIPILGLVLFFIARAAFASGD